LPELVEGPIVMSRSLSATKPCPATDALQIFKGNATASAFRGLDKGLANTVIRVLLKAGLTAREFAQSTLGRFGSDRLKNGAAAFVPLPFRFKFFARENLPITGNGDVNNAQVNSKPASWIEFWRLSDFADLMEKPLIIFKNQISLSLALFEKFQLSLASEERHSLAANGCPDVGCLVRKSPRENALIVGDCAMPEKDALVPVIEFVSIGDLGFQPNRNLSRKAKLLTGRIVDEFVKVKLLESFSPPSHTADIITGGISSLKRVKEQAEGEGLGNVETILADSSMLATGLSDRSMDVILVYDVMHDISEKMVLLEELHRVLKRDGFLSIFPMHMGTDKMMEIMKRCPLFRFRDSYTPPGHRTASEILNFE